MNERGLCAGLSVPVGVRLILFYYVLHNSTKESTSRLRTVEVFDSDDVTIAGFIFINARCYYARKISLRFNNALGRIQNAKSTRQTRHGRSPSKVKEALEIRLGLYDILFVRLSDKI